MCDPFVSLIVIKRSFSSSKKRTKKPERLWKSISSSRPMLCHGLPHRYIQRVEVSVGLWSEPKCLSPPDTEVGYLDSKEGSGMDQGPLTLFPETSQTLVLLSSVEIGHCVWQIIVQNCSFSQSIPPYTLTVGMDICTTLVNGVLTDVVQAEAWNLLVQWGLSSDSPAPENVP